MYFYVLLDVKLKTIKIYIMQLLQWRFEILRSNGPSLSPSLDGFALSPSSWISSVMSPGGEPGGVFPASTC